VPIARHNPEDGTPKVPEDGIPRVPKDSTPRAPKAKTPSPQTPTQPTPIVEWSAIHQTNLVNKSGQLAASLPGNREINMGWDLTTPTLNEPGSDNDL
jgi:hypothetical protein